MRQFLANIRKFLFWRVQCSWCGRTIKRPVVPLRHPHVSHGMCQACFRRVSQ